MEISVVIPTRNRSCLLRSCLDSLLAQSLSPTRFEIVVVDDGSGDDTPAVVEEYRKRFAALTFIRQENLGRGPARNAGIAHSSGRIVAFLDDDAAADTHWLERALPYFDEPGVGLVKGKVVPSDTEATPLSRTVKSGSVTDTHTCNIFYLREALRAVGGFTLGQFREDTDLAWRVLEAGYRRRFAEDAVAIHRTGRYPIGTLLRNHLALRKPYWDIYLAKRYPARYRADIAALGLFSPDLALYYPVYLSVVVTALAFWRLTPVTGFLCASYTLYVYATSVLIQTNDLCRGTTFRTLMRRKKELFQLLATWWVVMLADLFFHLWGMIRFRKLSL